MLTDICSGDHPGACAPSFNSVGIGSSAFLPVDAVSVFQLLGQSSCLSLSIIGVRQQQRQAFHWAKCNSRGQHRKLAEKVTCRARKGVWGQSKGACLYYGRPSCK